MDGGTSSPYIFLFRLLLIPFHVIGGALNQIYKKPKFTIFIKSRIHSLPIVSSFH